MRQTNWLYCNRQNDNDSILLTAKLTIDRLVACPLKITCEAFVTFVAIKRYSPKLTFVYRSDVIYCMAILAGKVTYKLFFPRWPGH